MKTKTIRAAIAAICVAATATPSFGNMPARYKQLDWLDTAGAQWVLTDYVPKCTDRFEMSVRLKSLDSTQCFYRLPDQRHDISVRPQVQRRRHARVYAGNGCGLRHCG